MKNKMVLVSLEVETDLSLKQLKKIIMINLKESKRYEIIQIQANKFKKPCAVYYHIPKNNKI